MKKTIYKKTVYFFDDPNGGSIENHDEEFDEVVWMSIQNAKEKLTYKDEFSILEKATKYKKWIVRFILGNKTIIRPKRKDIENDFQWRTDTELSDLDATVPINLSYEHSKRISVNELSKSSQWSEKFSIENHDIGNCMYYDVNRWEKSCEFGIMIGDKSFWNGGYGTDATINLLYYIYTETEIENVLHTLQNKYQSTKLFQIRIFSKKK